LKFAIVFALQKQKVLFKLTLKIILSNIKKEIHITFSNYIISQYINFNIFPSKKITLKLKSY